MAKKLGFSLIDVSSSFTPFGVFYSYNMTFHQNGTPFTIGAGDLDQLRLVFIPMTLSTSGKSAGNNLLDTFYEKDIDPTDYYQVMQYFDLEE